MDSSFDYVRRIVPATETYFSVAPYVGPGDIVGSASFWAGLRGYSRAYANSNGPAIDIVDSGGANPATINILSSGRLDEPTLAAWIVAHGTASINKLYDQTGVSGNLQESTVSNMPTITRNAFGSLSAMTFNGSTMTLSSVSGILTITAQPITYTGVLRTDGNDNSGASNRHILAADTPIRMLLGTVANGLSHIDSGTQVDGPAVSESVSHTIISIFNSPNSRCLIDGTDNGNLVSGGNVPTAAQVVLGGSTPTTNRFRGFITEGGIWPLGFTNTGLGGGSQADLMNRNQKFYWGF